MKKIINDNYKTNAFYKVNNIYYSILNDDTNTYGTPKKCLGGLSFFALQPLHPKFSNLLINKKHHS